MTILLILILITNLLYVGLLSDYHKSWMDLLKKKNDFSGDKIFPSVSIIIPVRNEEKNLPLLIRQLKEIDYPSDKLEIIFVDDHSDDNSFSLIKSSAFKILSAEEKGKKAALTTGINEAKNNWIVTIDADIIFENSWLKKLIFPAINNDAVMICGVVLIEKNHQYKWSAFQSMEFAVLQASGAASLQKNNPLLNSAANLAFKKDAWLSVNSYSSHLQIASGDDTFLMFDLHKKFPGKIISNPEAVVITYPAKSFHELLNQRLRWSGKTKYYRNNYISAVGFIVVAASLTTVFLFVMMMISFSIKILSVLLIIFFLRGFSELRLLIAFSKKYKPENGFLNSLMMVFFYPFFLLLLILLHPFKKSAWKGRKL